VVIAVAWNEGIRYMFRNIPEEAFATVKNGVNGQSAPKIINNK